MQMGFGLYQEQSQKLIMTMQMKQAIEVLQCSAIELQEYVTTFIEANPCAEVEPAQLSLIQSWLKQAVAGSGVSGVSLGTHAAPPLEQVIPADIGLEEELRGQIRFHEISSEMRRIVLFLIGCLDERGYFPEVDEMYAAMLGVPIEQIRVGIDVIQGCEPPGIGARNLQECLQLQLHLISDELRARVSLLIEHHLEDIAAGRITAIAKKLHLSTQQVQVAIDALRSLHPKPGLAYAVAKPQYVLPDITVEKVGPQFVVLTNESAVPTIRLNRAYGTLLNHPDGEAIKFLTKKLQSAQWLAHCLEQRRMTLYRVAEAIVSWQQAFFHFGAGSMRPLTLRQIADELGMHESTISRATRGKYMQTPRGVFEMKFFFSAELQSNSGVTSAEAAKHELRHFIQTENVEKPFSDEELVKLLAERGISISRRTIAKYREEMRIPGSTKRRRYN